MSLLVIQLPPRPRLSARSGEASPGPRLPAELDFVFSDDGRSVTSSGRSAPALLPKADSVVLVLADVDVAWHRLAIPKAAAARLPLALAGVLEEALLDDEDGWHFALAPTATPGQTGWVAVLQRPWLSAALTALEGAGVQVDRVAPLNAPVGARGGAADRARGHFSAPDPDPEAAPTLNLATPDGVVCISLAGALARVLQPPAELGVVWTATPSAAAAAERWLGVPVALRTDAEQALDAAVSGINLRQFELAARHRGTLALRDAWRRLLSPAWRPVRWGVAALLVVQLLGLNASAWQQRRQLVARQQAAVDLLRSTHPGVRAVLDPAFQMQRETERLRAAAGRAGDGDLEALLGAAAAAWPDGQGPAQTLKFEIGRLTLAAPGWPEPQMAQFRDRLRAAGYVAELNEGRITITRAGERGAAA